MKRPSLDHLALAVLLAVLCVLPFTVTGFVLYVVFRPDLLALRRIGAVIAGLVIGVGLAALYFRPVLHAYHSS